MVVTVDTVERGASPGEDAGPDGVSLVDEATTSPELLLLSPR